MDRYMRYDINKEEYCHGLESKPYQKGVVNYTN